MERPTEAAGSPNGRVGVSYLADGRATFARVDLDALAQNVRCIRGLLAPGVELMAVVKANGYGHGAVMVARVAVAAGAAQLGVATVDEGVELRRSGAAVPILVMGPVHTAEIVRALRHRLSLAVGDAAAVHAVRNAARALGGELTGSVHLKIDTGMRRYGTMPAAAVGLARLIAGHAELALDGVFTHFASADDRDDSFAQEQADLFDRCLADLIAAGVRPRYAHAANSAAALRSVRYGYDLVRVGIALYGLRPSPAIALPVGVRPVMSLHSRVARIIDLAPGDTVGYGRTYRAEVPERAALVPIGYADGYRRGLSSRAWMGLRERRADVRGRICMDQTVIAIPHGMPARVGDEVVIAGDAATGAPGLEELAELVDSIPYEVATGIARRVPRHFWQGARLVAIEDLHGLHELDD